MAGRLARTRLPGQSLIELIIAMFVIVVGLAGAAELIFSNSRAQERSANEVVAANLAREGIELAKAVRDSNWMAGNGTAFDSGLLSGTDYTAVPRMDGGAFIDFDFTPNLITDATAVLSASTNAGSPGLYVQGTGASGSPTIFSRLVTLDAICSDGSFKTSGTTCGALTKVGIRVTSLVRWTQRDGTHTTSMVDAFYDWR